MLPTLLTRADLPTDIVTVSPSQMSLWYTCRYKWQLEKLQGFSSRGAAPLNAKANKGVIIHRMLNKLLMYWIEMDQPISVTPLEVISRIGDEVSKEYPQYEDQILFYQCYKIFCEYTDWASQKETYLPLATEVETFAPTGLTSREGLPIYLHGIIDAIVEKDGSVGVMDHKSHTSRPWKPEEIWFDHQLIMYMLLLSLQDVDVDFGMINNINMQEYKDGRKVPDRFQRLFVFHKKVALEAYLKDFLVHIKEMWSYWNQSYPKRLDKNCGYCGFNQVCAEQLQGGTGQELLQIRHTKDAPQVEMDLDDITDLMERLERMES